ncbi:hypothetical protein SAMN04488103_101381 [Gemmobacter aquatilis]|uniref:Uncharacterized protein n=1 Tax=Gemmobacter aquatilis TaxID=933059 RepID=A0A1H7Z2C0_9RHOB|nr:hypothetical protein [Gemmobacter aquatilis]SEM52375.1 hypothetical protein SAMN04488103_101381 [Gemmobacter aquatilis]
MMLRALLLAVVLFAPGLAWAEIAKVRSGEHAGFSRLVITLAEPTRWKFGRSEDGYELRLDRAGIVFDLEHVFTRIPKTRIGAVASAGESRLTVTASCACHAEFFEFRPGIFVIDLKDGTPADGSGFETALEDSVPENHGSEMAYGWSDAQPMVKPGAAAEGPAAALQTSMMRESLLRELSLGAARGLVDMKPIAASGFDGAGQMTGQIRIGDDIGFDPHQGGGIAPMPAQSDICIEDAQLAMQDWTRSESPQVEIAGLREGLLKEFDKPDVGAVEKAAQSYLSLGFGLEARQLIAQFAPEMTSAPLLMSLGALVDGEHDPADTFGGMENCDTAAAMWSVLARPHLRPSERINAAAIVRAFSVLPPWLRRSLVLPLGERLLEQGDLEAARRISDAADRVSPQGVTGAALIDAELLMRGGETAKAQKKLLAIAGERGALEPEALIAHVELAAAQKSAVSPAIISDLSALVQQHSGLDLELRLLHALILAEALNGDFGAAMKDAERAPEARAEVWSLLAETGPDTAVLEFAVLGQAGPRPEVSRETGIRFAERLVRLGFGEEAALWLSAVAPESGSRTEQERLLFARIALAGRNALSALRHLAGISSPEATKIRAEAQMQLGDFPAAAVSLKQTGDMGAIAQATRLSQHWQGVAAQDNGAWKTAASFAVSQDATRADTENVTLSAAARIASESQAAREAMDALLSPP